MATVNGNYTFSGASEIRFNHSVKCSYSVTRSSDASPTLSIHMEFTVTCGSYTRFESPQGDSQMAVNGTWYDYGTNAQVDRGYTGSWISDHFKGLTLNKGDSQRYEYDVDISWAKSDALRLCFYVDYDAGGWGPTPAGGVNKQISVTPPAYNPPPTYTACTAPTSFTSGTQFYGNLNGGDGNVTVSWSGASGGTNNAITGYAIQAQYPGGDWYDKWSGTGNSTTLNFDGEAGKTIAINLRIQTRGAAGSSYYSGWKTGSVIALGRTACSAPANVYINSNSDSNQYVNPGSTVRLYWSGAAGGLNNAISRYYIQRRKNGGAWGAASDHNASSGDSQSLDNTEGAYFEFQVRTEGAAGSSYYSGYKLSRNRVYNRSKPTVGTPTVSVSADKSKLVIEWTSGSGTGNAISKQEVYARSRSTATGTWSGYTKIATDPTRPFIWSGGNPGYYYQFYVVVTGEYYSSAQSSVSAQIQYPVSAVGGAYQLSLTAGEKRVGQPWTLTWRAGSAGINNPVKQHRIYYRRSDGTRELIATLPAGTTSYSGTWPDVNVVAIDIQEVGTISGYDSGYSSVSVSILPPTYIYLKTTSGFQKIRPNGIKSVWIKEASGVTMLWTK